MKTFIDLQGKSLGISKIDIAKSLGISRPTLGRYAKEPYKFTVKQLNTLLDMGFTVPYARDAKRMPVFTPTVCPSCDGTGWLYKIENTDHNAGGQES